MSSGSWICSGEFDEKDPNDPSTWYAPQRRDHMMKELNGTGMVEIYNHQYLWDNRQEQRVYDAFVDIWDMEELWVTIDRANLNPPKKVPGQPQRLHPLGQRHLARSAADRRAGRASASSSRTATSAASSAFPSCSTISTNWVKTQPADRDPMHPDSTGLTITNIEMKPGDLLIFNTLLAHGVRPNHSKDRVRMAQYISMFPADEDDLVERTERIRLWRDLEAPKRDAFPGDPREWEKKNAHNRQALATRRKAARPEELALTQIREDRPDQRPFEKSFRAWRNRRWAR